MLKALKVMQIKAEWSTADSENKSTHSETEATDSEATARIRKLESADSEGNWDSGTKARIRKLESLIWKLETWIRKWEPLADLDMGFRRN